MRGRQNPSLRGPEMTNSSTGLSLIVATSFFWSAFANSALAVDYSVGANPRSVAVGDFNGDGAQDLAVANRGSNDVSVLLGNGDGTFQATPSIGAGTAPYSVSIGDFNGDGFQDLAVANAGDNTVSVLLGYG